MGKTATDKRSAGAPPSGTADGAGTSAHRATTPPSAVKEPVEPLERARLQAEVARQRVRIAKEELKRARKRVKEARREAKRARKQAAAARKAWKKARKAHRASPAPEPSGGKGKTASKSLKGGRGAARKSVRRERSAAGNPGGR